MASTDSPVVEQCPRCESRDTKFCYYNNYNTSQPRHFCRSCRRYWTLGGSLRNVPFGGSSSRKRPRPSSPSFSAATAKSDRRALPITTVSPVDHHHHHHHHPDDVGPGSFGSLLTGPIPVEEPLLDHLGCRGGFGLGLGLGSGSIEELGFGLVGRTMWPTWLGEEDEEEMGVGDTWKIASGGAAAVEGGDYHLDGTRGLDTR